MYICIGVCVCVCVCVGQFSSVAEVKLAFCAELALVSSQPWVTSSKHLILHTSGESGCFSNIISLPSLSSRSHCLCVNVPRPFHVGSGGSQSPYSGNSLRRGVSSQTRPLTTPTDHIPMFVCIRCADMRWTVRRKVPLCEFPLPSSNHANWMLGE